MRQRDSIDNSYDTSTDSQRTGEEVKLADESFYKYQNISLIKA